jgi:hypothetical protein
MKHIHYVLIIFFAGFVVPSSQAERTVTRAKREALAITQDKATNGIIRRKTASTNFSGGWHGVLVLVRSSCSGFPSSFGFRHIATLNGNRVVLRTTHDGTLLGMTRDKGRRLEVVRQYKNNGALISP